MWILCFLCEILCLDWKNRGVYGSIEKNRSKNGRHCEKRCLPLKIWRKKDGTVQAGVYRVHGREPGIKIWRVHSEKRKKIPVLHECGAYVTGSQLKRLGEYYAKAIHDNYGLDFDVLFGPAYKGIPLSVVTAIAIHDLYGVEVRYCSNRKEAKDHGGDAGLLLGSKIKDGDRVVIIEDVTTSGKSIEETFPIIQAQGNVEIKGLMVSLNRMERGKGDKSALEEIQETYGFPANAIVTMEDVITYLYNRPCQGKIQIDDKMKAAIDAYYEEYGVK